MELFKKPPPADPPVHRPGQPWTIAEAAAYLRCTVRTLRNHAKAGSVKLTRVGNRVFMPDAELNRIAATGFDAAPAIPPAPWPTAAGHLPNGGLARG